MITEPVFDSDTALTLACCLLCKAWCVMGDNFQKIWCNPDTGVQASHYCAILFPLQGLSETVLASCVMPALPFS